MKTIFWIVFSLISSVSVAQVSKLSARGLKIESDDALIEVSTWCDVFGGSNYTASGRLIALKCLFHK